jgi:hypothetical protein
MVKLEKISIKLTSHSLDDDRHINDAFSAIIGRLHVKKITIDKLGGLLRYPHEFRLTVWFVPRHDWVYDIHLSEFLTRDIEATKEDDEGDD